jgi:hypothetical protein
MAIELLASMSYWDSWDCIQKIKEKEKECSQTFLGGQIASRKPHSRLPTRITGNSFQFIQNLAHLSDFMVFSKPMSHLYRNSPQ